MAEVSVFTHIRERLAMILNTSAYTVELFDGHTGYVPPSTDNAIRCDRAYSLSDGISSTTHGIRVTADGRPIASVVLLAGGGASGIHDNSAFVRADALFVAVGPFVVRLAIPSLDLLWSVETDEATCFGIHPIPESTDFISHGELSIARVTDDGCIIWSGSGADIFTGELTVLSHEVRVADFEGRCYTFALITGVSKLLPLE
ncbi:MAG: hypothetical protein SFY80_06225 [Verrucomicrobiota bacterium]|nr:hypothetical protein [Verrucomicrobiota bacterium]